MQIKRYRGALLLALTAAMMLGVYLFSAQSGERSSNLSQEALELVRRLLPGVYELLARGGRPEFALRKLAHLSEYALLGLIVYALLRKKLSPLPAAVTALVLCVGFAITDEWHQLYVPGRDGNIRDVFIDSAGSSVGIGLGLLGTGLRWALFRQLPIRREKRA